MFILIVISFYFSNYQRSKENAVVVYKETDTEERAKESESEIERLDGKKQGQRQSWTKRGRYMTICLGSYQRKHRSPYGPS